MVKNWIIDYSEDFILVNRALATTTFTMKVPTIMNESREVNVVVMTIAWTLII